jgi:hypothetical protein
MLKLISLAVLDMPAKARPRPARRSSAADSTYFLPA